MFFDYSIGNPPYQQKIGVRKTGQYNYKKIYDIFQQKMAYISQKTSLIYPSGWQSSSQYYFTQWIFNKGLMRSDFYYGEDIFGDSIIKGYPICVLHFSLGYKGKAIINGIEVDKSSGLCIDTIKKKILFNKIKNYDNFLSGAQWIGGLNNIEDTEGISFYDHDDGLVDPVKIFIKRKPRCRWYLSMVLRRKKCYV